MNDQINRELFETPKNGRLEVVKYLLSTSDGGVDPNIADEDNITPLLWSSYRDHLKNS